jgi:hypothetical protein
MTVIFTIELGLNMFAHLFWEFVTNGWSMFDLVVVSVSLVKPLLPEDTGPTKVLTTTKPCHTLAKSKDGM